MKGKKNDIDGSQSVKLVRKSNNLVEGKYRFDIWEMRVFTKMLTMIYPDDEDFKEYRIYLKDVIEDFNLTADKQSYKLLKSGAVKLMKKEIKIVRDTDEGEKEFLTHIAVGLDSFTSKTQGSYLDISFHPKMKPFLLQLQTQFLMYDVRNVLQLQSSFSVRIYELLKQYEKIGKRTFSVSELKDTLAVADKYPLYANFKQRVILKAQEDLATYTDIRFTFEEEKKGKAVHSIIFKIISNKTVVEERKQATPINIRINSSPLVTEDETQAIFERVKMYSGATINTVQEWLKHYEQDFILERIELVKKLLTNGTKIKNPMGYLQRLMQENLLFSPQKQVDKTVVVTEKKENVERLVLIKQKEQGLQDLRASYYDRQNRLIQEFFSHNPDVRAHLLETLKHGADYNHQMTLEENLTRISFVALLNAKVREQYPIVFKDLDERFNAFESALKQELRVLGWNG